LLQGSNVKLKFAIE